MRVHRGLRDCFEEGFAYLDLNGGQVMLEQRGRKRLFNSSAVIPAATVAGRFSNLVIAALNSSTIASNPAICCVFDGPLDAILASPLPTNANSCSPVLLGRCWWSDPSAAKQYPGSRSVRFDEGGRLLHHVEIVRSLPGFLVIDGFRNYLGGAAICELVARFPSCRSKACFIPMSATTTTRSFRARVARRCFRIS